MPVLIKSVIQKDRKYKNKKKYKNGVKYKNRKAGTLTDTPQGCSV